MQCLCNKQQFCDLRVFFLFLFIDNAGDTDAIETALQISQNLLTTPDNEDSLEPPFPRSVSFLDRAISQKSSYLDSKHQADIKRLLEILRKQNKRYAEFLGKRFSNISKPNDEKRAMEFLGKRNAEFLGKRDDTYNPDKRYMEFLGKRTMEFLGKRAMEFLGKRYRYRNHRSGDWIG